MLRWVADEGRVLLTHNVNTLIETAYQRTAREERMPGVLAVPQEVPIGIAIQDALLIIECSLEGEWEGQVKYIPIR